MIAVLRPDAADGCRPGHSGLSAGARTSKRPAAMIVLAALVIGAFLGWRRARALGGNRMDRVQYAAVFGMVFAVTGMVVTILIDRMI